MGKDVSMQGGNTNFDIKLRDFRAKNNISQEVLAEHVGCSVSTISRLERGDISERSKAYKECDSLVNGKKEVVFENRNSVRTRTVTKSLAYSVCEFDMPRVRRYVEEINSNGYYSEELLKLYNICGYVWNCMQVYNEIIVKTISK